jgi:hypothetical protein
MSQRSPKPCRHRGAAPYPRGADPGARRQALCDTGRDGSRPCNSLTPDHKRAAALFLNWFGGQSSRRTRLRFVMDSAPGTNISIPLRSTGEISDFLGRARSPLRGTEGSNPSPSSGEAVFAVSSSKREERRELPLPPSLLCRLGPLLPRPRPPPRRPASAARSISSTAGI